MTALTMARDLFLQAEQAKTVATQPTAIAPAPTMTPVALQPTGAQVPALPGQTNFGSTAALYPTAGGSSGITDFSSSPNVQAAAISPDPTALTMDNLTPEAQEQNRANLFKVVGVAVLIWVILSKTGR